jgi:hypothetical protein
MTAALNHFVACVGSRCVERAGLRGLADLPRGRELIVRTQKGREAISFTLIDH